MKTTTLLITLSSLLLFSCASSQSYRSAMEAYGVCSASYNVWSTKLDEAVDIYVSEFERLQRQGEATAEIRKEIIAVSTGYFPQSQATKLEPLLRRGCLDADPGVRKTTMTCMVCCEDISAATMLSRFAEDAPTDIRAEILHFLENLESEQGDKAEQ